MSSLANVINQLAVTRTYTLRILEDIDQSLWFRMPGEGVTHIAWQVGHLAMADYRLGIIRLREPRPDDATWFPSDFMKLFGQGSTPVADASIYPSADRIREVFQATYEHKLAELPTYDDEQLEQPALVPHPLFTKKIDSLWWCARHEAVHAGQIALLKRLLGNVPQW